MPAMSRSYKDALRLLAARRRPTRPVQSSGRIVGELSPTPDLRGEPSISGMREWLHTLGHQDADLRALHVIHVAGTKGKGSTCAFTDALLRAHGRRTGFPQKTGMYTSPHLVSPQERVRLDFKPLLEEAFAKYFFEVTDLLDRASESSGPQRSPRYLQLWALIAFHTFIRQKIDVAIIETHHGGEFDATNFLQEPVVTAITTLGMDHVDQLGPTLANIAWHKAGIMKTGAVAITAPQTPEAASVLVARAEEKGVSLEVADPSSLPAQAVSHLPSEVLRTNCSIAVAAANAWLRTMRPGQQLSNEDITNGVADFSWPGRFQRLTNGAEQWYLDAAHNELSMSKAAQWFAEVTSGASNASRMLLFSHISNNRDGAEVFRELLRALREHDVQLSAVVLSTYARAGKVDTTDAALDSVHDLWQTYTTVLSDYYAEVEVHTAETVDTAVSIVQQLASKVNNPHILATGSQYLLGGVLQVLDAS